MLGRRASCPPHILTGAGALNRRAEGGMPSLRCMRGSRRMQVPGAGSQRLAQQHQGLAGCSSQNIRYGFTGWNVACRGHEGLHLASEACRPAGTGSVMAPCSVRPAPRNGQAVGGVCGTAAAEGVAAAMDATPGVWRPGAQTGSARILTLKILCAPPPSIQQLQFYP